MTLSRLPLFVSWAALSTLSSSIYAVDQGIAALGFSGALSTPVAETLAVGQATFAYSPYLDGQGIDVVGDNYVVGAGLWSGVEVFGRLASNNTSTNCFQGDCGLRDLSASFKVQAPKLAPLLHLPDAAWVPDVAVGMTDVGGSATYFRASYGVATWDQASWAVSMGFSHAPANGQLKARLDGAFGSVVLQPLPWLQGIVEHDGTALQGGLRFLSPARWLPAGVRVQGEVRHSTAQADRSNDRVWWGLSAQLPLAGWSHTVAVPQILAVAAPAEPVIAPTRPLAASALEGVLTTYETALTRQQPSIDARVLADQLSRAGFQQIRIGYRQGQWVVVLENQAYAHNTLDALGVALGLWSAWSKTQTDRLLLTLEQEGQPVWSVASDQPCLTAWFQTGERCAAGVLHPVTEPVSQQGWRSGVPWGADNRPWLINNAKPSMWRPRVQLAPVLNYALGTEYGNLDYSLGLATTVDVPVLWSGLLADLRYTTPLLNSADYQTGGVFADEALQRGVDRAMLHQYVQVPNGWSAHAAVGRLFEHYEGALTEGRWQSPTGAHKVSMVVGRFEDTQSTAVAQPVVAGYRYQFARHDVQLGAQVGEFFDGDHGYLLTSRFAFADTFISLFYRSTQKDPEPTAQHYIGVQLSMPLTPWRVRPTAYGQLKGTAEYNQSVQTEVADDINAVAGAGQRGRLAQVPQSLDVKLYNRDRLSTRYLDMHLDRLRAAYLQSLTTP